MLTETIWHGGSTESRVVHLPNERCCRSEDRASGDPEQRRRNTGRTTRQRRCRDVARVRCRLQIRLAVQREPERAPTCAENPTPPPRQATSRHRPPTRPSVQTP